MTTSISEHETRKKYIDKALSKEGWIETYIKEELNPVKSDFKNKIPSFITGGKFSSDPTAYLKADYRALKNTNDLFEVSKTTSSLVSKEVSNRNDNIPILVSIIIICSVLFIVIFFLKNGIKFM